MNIFSERLCESMPEAFACLFAEPLKKASVLTLSSMMINYSQLLVDYFKATPAHFLELSTYVQNLERDDYCNI